MNPEAEVNTVGAESGDQKDMIIGVDLARGESRGVETPIQYYADPAFQPPAEEQPSIDIEKAKKLFGINESIKAITKVRDEIVTKQNDVLGNEGISKAIEENLVPYTVEQLKAFGPDKVDELFTDAEGNEIEISLDFKGNKDREFQFKRDFLVYMKESSEAIKNIDVELKQLEESLAADQDEFNKLVASFGDVHEYIRSTLEEEYEKAEGPRKEQLALMRQAYEDALTLENIYDHYTKFKTASVITDMYHRSDVVFAKYMRVHQALRIRTDLTRYDNLETKFLEEKYHAHPNLLLFAIMRYFAYKGKDTNRKADGVFLIQLGVSLQALFTDSFKSEEDKQRFLNGARKVLDLFI